MEVRPTPDQEALIRVAVETGRLQKPEDAVEEALSLWEARERARFEILDAVDAAEASVARGAGRLITENSLRELASEVKRRGRARLEADGSTLR